MIALRNAKDILPVLPSPNLIFIVVQKIVSVGASIFLVIEPTSQPKPPVPMLMLAMILDMPVPGSM